MESRWLTFARILSIRTATTYAATTISAAPINNLSNLLCFKGNPLFHFQQSAFSTVARVARLFTKNFLWRTRKQHALGARAILARGAYQAAAVIQPREPIRALKDHWQYAGNFYFARSDSCSLPFQGKIIVGNQPIASAYRQNGSCPRLRPEQANHVWSYDFVSGRTQHGRTNRMLTLIDEYSRSDGAV